MVLVAIVHLTSRTVLKRHATSGILGNVASPGWSQFNTNALSIFQNVGWVEFGISLTNSKLTTQEEYKLPTQLVNGNHPTIGISPNVFINWGWCSIIRRVERRVLENVFDCLSLLSKASVKVLLV